MSVLPNLNYEINNFNGEFTDCGFAQEWITAFKTLGQLNNWESLCLLEAIRSHLTDAARNWYLGRQQELNTWDVFKKRFKETFMSELSVIEKWKRAQSRTQQ